MKSRKIQEDLSCGLVVAMKILGSKWKPCILDAISHGNTRPSQIQRQIRVAPPRVIEMQLRELQLFGIVDKKVYVERPLRTEYSITPTGQSLIKLIKAIDVWGTQNRHILELHPDYAGIER
ncbi:MAG TPA: helix-turn-helix domain-containing protein [Chryseolinea sp.]